MPGTPNQQLTNLLENFANQIPGGTSSQYYQTIFNAIVNSPQALAQYNSAAAASSTPLSAINYNTQSSASEFSPSNNSINFASDMLSTMQSLGYSPAQIANSVTNIAGHEIWHYSNNVEIQQEIGSLNSSLQSSINSWNKANGPQPVDSYVAARQSADLADEANAAIQGWDDVVSAAVAAQNGAPLTQAQITALVQQTPYANTLFNTTTGNALPGITVDESGSIDATSANVQAESAIIGVQPVSGVGTDLPSGTGPIDYNQYYGAAAIEQVCADEAGTAFSVNYSNLNLNVPVAGSGGGTLTTEQVDEALIQAAAPNGGLALGSTAGCTIINSATGGTSTFTQGPNPTVLKFLPDESDPAPDPLTGPPTPPPITGNLSGSGWETVIDTENANPGGTHSDIFGTAASLVESNNFDPITVLPGASGQITGSTDSIYVDAGATASVQGNGDYMYAASGDSVSVTGTNDFWTLETNVTVTVGANSIVTLIGNSDTAHGASGDTITINGSHNVLTGSASSTWTIDGSYDQLTISGTSSTVTLNGSSETVSASSDTVDLGNNATATLTGNSNSLTLGTGVALTLNGTGETVTGSSDFLTLGNNASATITGTSNRVILGTSDTVTMGTSSSATLTGNSDTIADKGSDTITADGSGNTLTESSGGTWTINGSNDKLTIAAASSTATLTGSGETVSASGDTVNLGNNATATLTGNSDTMTLGTSVAVTLNGTGEKVTGSSDFLTLGANGGATVTGNSDSVSTGSSDSVTVNGNSDTVTLGSSNTLTLTGTGNKITSSSDTITLGNSSKSVISGPTNTLTLGSSDQILAKGSSDTINVKSGDIVDLASNVAVTIVGSGATIVGNTGDTLSLTGTSDNVFADSSSITVNGTDTGDVVHGNADTGNRTNWGGYVAASGAYGGYSGGGYYHGHGGSPVRANSLRIPRSGIEESAWADRAGSHLWRSDPTTQVHSAGWTVLPAGTAASIDQLIHAMASFNATQSTGVSDAVHPVGLFEQPQLAMPVNLRKPPLQVHGQL